MNRASFQVPVLPFLYFVISAVTLFDNTHSFHTILPLFRKIMDAQLVTHIQALASKRDLTTLPDIRTGMQVEVHQRITEGEKTRIQIFKGLVIRTGGKTAGEKSFMVRRTTGGVGIEKIFPLACPTIEKVDIIRQYKVRRKNLFYMRDLSGKAARLKEKVTKK